MALRRLMTAANGGAGPIETVIRRKLTEALHPTVLDIANDSRFHAHHAGIRGSSNKQESHFRLNIVSSEFAGKPKPMRHRLVYKLLADELARENGVHALQLTTKTPEEAPEAVAEATAEATSESS